MTTTSSDAEPSTDPAAVMAVRRKLVAEGTDYLERRHTYGRATTGNAEPVDPLAGAAAAAAYEGCSSAGTCMIGLAGILRYLDQEAPEHALIVARIVDEVLECGMEALEDVNADLEMPEAGGDQS